MTGALIDFKKIKYNLVNYFKPELYLRAYSKENAVSIYIKRLRFKKEDGN
jgi:hypothetical protein